MYGVDVESDVFRDRSWRWLRLRIMGLLSTECRTRRRFNPPDTGQKRGR